MKGLLQSFLFLALPLLTYAQQGLVSGNLNITSIPTNNGNGTFTVVGTFSDPKGQFFASDVTDAHIMWKGNNYFPIESVDDVSGSTLTFTVQDTFSIGFIPTGNAQIGQETQRLKLPGVSPTGDSNSSLATPPDHASLFNFILQRIDNSFASVYEGSSAADTSTISNPVEGDVLIAGDQLVFHNGDRWIIYQPTGSGGTGGGLQDTITQNGHGFFVGTMVGQTIGNGPYFPANSAVADSFPVAFVSDVVDANRFVVQNEGFLTWTHGRALGQDWFLQDDGSFGTSPDAQYNIFGFRTFTTNRAYFDVPELILMDSIGSGGSGGSGTTITGFTYNGNVLEIQTDQGNFSQTINTGTLQTSGPITIDGTTYNTGTDVQTILEALATAVNNAGGGGGATVIASNGNFDADGTSNVDVELGGPLEHNTTITTGSFSFDLDGNNNLYSQSTSGLRIVPSKTAESSRVQGSFLRKNTAAGSNAYVTYSPYGLPYTSPLTFDTNYKLRYLSDGTMTWARTPVDNNGIGVSSTFTGGEWVETVNLGGDLSQNTIIDPSGFSFQIRDVPASNNYQYNFEINQSANQPFMAWSASSPAVVIGSQTTVDARFEYDEVLLQISDVPNSKVGLLQITPTQVRLDFESKQFIINDNGFQLTGTPNYANDAAADSDSNLPSGGIYTITGDRSLRIKP